jgi:hypothetical protein
METSALVSHECVGKCDKALAEGYRWGDAVNRLVDDVWAALVEGNNGVSVRQGTLRKDELSCPSPALPLYTTPPPSYDDAIADLPPDYSTLPPLATQKSVFDAPVTPAAKSRDQSSALLKDRSLDVYIDFENPVGVREHKKKKGGAAPKKVSAPPPPADNGGSSDNPGDDQAAGDGGGDAGGGDGGGDGDGDGDGGENDGWNDWTTSGSKKKNKKKEEEEEEERKAAEAAAGNKLSWADDMDEGADDSWAGFATVGKKKKGKVSFEICNILNPSDPDCSPKLRLAGSKM